MDTIKIGEIVKATYNSGIYIGKVLEDRKNFWLVKVLAVEKHPNQGDLHNPGQVEGVAFYERKALAFQEKMNARKRTTRTFQGEIPDYNTSLTNAVAQLKESLLTEKTPYNTAALQKLNDLENHFYNKKS